MSDKPDSVDAEELLRAIRDAPNYQREERILNGVLVVALLSISGNALLIASGTVTTKTPMVVSLFVLAAVGAVMLVRTMWWMRRDTVSLKVILAQAAALRAEYEKRDTASDEIQETEGPCHTEKEEIGMRAQQQRRGNDKAEPDPGNRKR